MFVIFSTTTSFWLLWSKSAKAYAYMSYLILILMRNCSPVSLVNQVLKSQKRAVKYKICKNLAFWIEELSNFNFEILMEVSVCLFHSSWLLDRMIIYLGPRLVIYLQCVYYFNKKEKPETIKNPWGKPEWHWEKIWENLRFAQGT